MRVGTIGALAIFSIGSLSFSCTAVYSASGQPSTERCNELNSKSVQKTLEPHEAEEFARCALIEFPGNLSGGFDGTVASEDPDVLEPYDGLILGPTMEFEG